MKTKARYTFVTNESEYQILLHLMKAGIIQRKKEHQKLMEEEEMPLPFEELHSPELVAFKQICSLTEKGRDEWYFMVRDGHIDEEQILFPKR